MKKQFQMIALASAVVAAGGAFAANDGTLGLTSTGDLTITLDVTDAVLISGMSDIALGTANGTAPLSGTSNVCVYRNNANTNYQITAVGDGTAGAFTVASGADTIAYEVRVDDQNSGATLQTATTGVAVTGLTGADNVDQDCNTAGPNGLVEVTVSTANQAGAPIGNYSGVLFLTVAPE